MIDDVREMTAADAGPVAALRAAAWRHAYAGIVPASALAAMSVPADAERHRARLADRRRRGTDLVAVSGGVPVGWVAFGPSRDEDTGPEVAEVYALYVRPDLTGRGIGRAVLATAHGRLLAGGSKEVSLWVLEANAPSRRFYDRGGYRPDGGTRDDVHGAVVVPEVRYRRSLVRAAESG